MPCLTPSMTSRAATRLPGVHERNDHVRNVRPMATADGVWTVACNRGDHVWAPDTGMTLDSSAVDGAGEQLTCTAAMRIACDPGRWEALRDTENGIMARLRRAWLRWRPMRVIHRGGWSLP